RKQVDVRPQTAVTNALLHDTLDRKRDVVQLKVAGTHEDLAGEALDDHGTRVFDVVDAVADTRDLDPSVQHLRDLVLRTRGVADLHKKTERLFVRSAVGRT